MRYPGLQLQMEIAGMGDFGGGLPYPSATLGNAGIDTDEICAGQPDRISILIYGVGDVEAA